MPGETGVPFILNDRPDVALALAADGVHLGQRDVPVALARRILGTAIVGVSTTPAPRSIGSWALMS